MPREVDALGNPIWDEGVDPYDRYEDPEGKDWQEFRSAQRQWQHQAHIRQQEEERVMKKAGRVKVKAHRRKRHWWFW